MVMPDRMRPADPPPSYPANAIAGAAEAALRATILGIAAGEFGLRGMDMESTQRSAELVRARAFVTWAMRSLGVPASYNTIGALLGNRDHATIINLHEKAMDYRQRDVDFRDACDRLEAQFQRVKEAFR